MLGELYKPKGLALETASAVFQSENVHACNVAWGCTNCCKDCYIQYIKRGHIRYPKEKPGNLVEHQLKGGFKTDGVFISFNTDPLLQTNMINTVNLVMELRERCIPVAILSKMGHVPISSFNFWHKKIDIRHGMTIKSGDEKFRMKFEPNAKPINFRITELRDLHLDGEYTWVSDEPHPCPALYKQNDQKFWESINFVDFIIFGKWNYNKLASTPESRDYYSETVPKFIDFCNDHGIRYHVKSETMDFIKKEVI